MTTPPPSLSPQDCERFRAQLQSRRQQLEEKLGSIRDEQDAERHALSSAGSRDFKDESALEQSGEYVLALRGVLQAELLEVTAALERFARGSYGTCAACGELIPHARLLSYPEAIRCIRCQAKVEDPG